MTPTDRTLLRVTAALLRGRVIPERVQDELAAALDRIAGVGAEQRTPLEIARAEEAKRAAIQRYQELSRNCDERSRA